MKRIATGCAAFLIACVPCRGQRIVDHTCTDITAIPTNWISQARQDLHDYAMGGDVGYWPQWLENTTNYLNNPANADVNVIMWSWCGQVDSHYASGFLINAYLAPMSQLELDYPDVTFVYMTGHVDIWDDANNKVANNAIRQYCLDNGKVLYDFADIERYDPDGRYFEFVNDNCDYYDAAFGTHLGNWATEWQNTHTEDIDWYDCGAAHSVSLNANQKAYAAWWMFARLAGWSGDPEYDSWSVNFFSAEEITVPEIAGKYATPTGIGFRMFMNGRWERIQWQQINSKFNPKRQRMALMLFFPEQKKSAAISLMFSLQMCSDQIGSLFPHQIMFSR